MSKEFNKIINDLLVEVFKEPNYIYTGKLASQMSAVELRELADKKDSEIYDTYFRLVEALEVWTKDQLIPSMEINDIPSFTMKVKNGKLTIKTGVDE